MIKLIERAVNEDHPEDIQVFHRSLNEVENTVAWAELVALANDAAYYRRNPANLTPYVCLLVVQHEDFDPEQHYHYAEYVLERLECSNMDPEHAYLPVCVLPGETEPDIQIGQLERRPGRFDPDGREVLLEQVYGVKAQAEMERLGWRKEIDEEPVDMQ